MIKNTEVDDEEEFLKCVSSERITIVSDGGLRRTGSFGWVLACDEEVIAKCHGPVRGSEDQLTSFRSEICGMASATLILSKVAEELEIKPEVSLL